MSILFSPAIDMSFSSYVVLLRKLVLRYHAYKEIDVQLTGDYKTDRELIFGRGGFIKDSPLVKAVMMITGYVKSKYYVKPDEEFSDKIVSIYGDKYGRYFFIEVLSALMCRITNYFQAIQGVRDEDPLEIKMDINSIIDELIQRLRDSRYNITFKVYLYDSPQAYEVLVEIYEETQ